MMLILNLLKSLYNAIGKLNLLLSNLAFGVVYNLHVERCTGHYE